MPLRLIDRFRHRVPKEEELQQAEARLRRDVPVQFISHPDRSELERFAAGQYPEGDLTIKRIFDHLHDCDVCLTTMAEVRGRSGTDQRMRVRRRYGLLFAAAAVLILTAIFFLAIRAPKPQRIATVDLRQVTRGQEGSPIVVNRESAAIRVALPAGSAGGYYDLGIFSSATPSVPLFLSSAQAGVENGDEVITVSIPIQKLKPGSYLLGIRRGSSEWSQYVINIK